MARPRVCCGPSCEALLLRAVSLSQQHELDLAFSSSPFIHRNKKKRKKKAAFLFCFGFCFFFFSFFRTPQNAQSDTGFRAYETPWQEHEVASYRCRVRVNLATLSSRSYVAHTSYTKKQQKIVCVADTVAETICEYVSSIFEARLLRACLEHVCGQFVV